MLKRLGHFIIRRRWAVILVWLVIVAISAIVAPGASDKLVPGVALPQKGEAYEGHRILEQELGIRTNSLIIVFTSESLRADSSAFMDQQDDALAGLKDIPELCDPLTYRSTGDPRFISDGGHTTYALIGVEGDEAVASRIVPLVRDSLHQQSDLRIYVTGQDAVARDIEAAGTDHVARASVYTFPLLAVVLLLVFGSLVSAGLPLVIGGVSMAISLGFVYVLSDFVLMNSAGLTIVLFLGLAHGVDYSLIMVLRFREELRKGKGINESLVTTMSTSGLAICAAAITTIIGLGAMISFDSSIMRAIGIGAVSVVALAWLASLTLLPALLSILGTRINRLALFNLAGQEGSFWERLAKWVMRHPLPILGVTVPVFLLLALPLFAINPTSGSYSLAPEETESRVGMETLLNDFGASAGSPILICVTTDSEVTDGENIHWLYDYTRRIALNEQVARVESIVDLDPSITREQYVAMYADPESITDARIIHALESLTSERVTVVSVYTYGEPMGKEASDLVKWLRDLETGGLTTHVAGPAAYSLDLTNQLIQHFWWVLLFMMAASYLILLRTFKSVLAPLKAVALNLLGVTATVGIVIFVFQWGNFAELLNFTTDGTIVVFTLMIMFCIMFGLSMDYEVFLMSRMREEWDRKGDVKGSVTLGLGRTGRIITGSALVMAVVFGSLVSGDLLAVKIVGFGLALSILLDATFIRIFMIPSLMRLVGKPIWWAPKFLERLWTKR